MLKIDEQLNDLLVIYGITHNITQIWKNHGWFHCCSITINKNAKKNVCKKTHQTIITFPHLIINIYTLAYSS